MIIPFLTNVTTVNHMQHQLTLKCNYELYLASVETLAYKPNIVSIVRQIQESEKPRIKILRNKCVLNLTSQVTLVNL